MMSVCTLALSLNTFAMDKVVYGEDNRLDIFEVSSARDLTLAKATAAAVKNYNVTKQENGSYKLSGGKLSVCEGEKFDGQVTSAFCSGFLVEHNDKQYLVTAGHCIKSTNECSSHKWVFDFNVQNADQTSHTVDADSVYTCKRVVDRALESSTGLDYAVLELDRRVTGREPLAMRTSGKIEKGEEILVIGHPTGLPSKVAGDAYVRENNRSAWFSTNLDTFGGNSGSAVFNADSGEVEGILVRGHTDYTWTRDSNGKSCRRPVYCEMGSCRGEDVTRITSIKYFQN